MFSKLHLTKPGLFVTATDTEVGKTVVTCAIADNLRRAGLGVGVSKPISTGCRRDREGLVNEDAEALAHFADCRMPLDVINPVRFVPPVAPAVAEEMTDSHIDYNEMARCLGMLDERHDVMLIEGIGGLLVPLELSNPKRTVLDLIKAIGYPALIVTRAGLGTLNHTAMTVRLLKHAGCRVAGIVINGYEPDVPKGKKGEREDPAMRTNRVWLERMNRVPILATVPKCDASMVAVHKGKMPAAIRDAVDVTYWPDVLSEPRRADAG